MKKTEKLLIDITFDLLYKKGYCATSLTDILDRAEMTKGAMYYHFKSKHALVLATIEHYLEDILTAHWVKPLEESENTMDALVKQVGAYSTLFTNKKHFLNVKHGCPLSNFILDMSDQDEELFTYMESVYKRWHLCVEEALIKAQENKQTKTSFDAKKQALFIISSIEGSIGSAKAYNDINALKDSFEIITNYIKSL